MANRSLRLEIPSPERYSNNIQVQRPNQDNVTLTNDIVDCQENLGETTWDKRATKE